MNLLKLYWVIIDGDEGHFEIYRSYHAARHSRDNETPSSWAADHGITPTVPEPVPMLLDPVLAEPLVKE